MHWAREYILSTAPGSGIGGEGRLPPPPPKPHEVLMAAWEYTVGEKVRFVPPRHRPFSPFFAFRCFSPIAFSRISLLVRG